MFDDMLISLADQYLPCFTMKNWIEVFKRGKKYIKACRAGKLIFASTTENVGV
jgi:hypothetical protein